MNRINDIKVFKYGKKYKLFAIFSAVMSIISITIISYAVNLLFNDVINMHSNQLLSQIVWLIVGATLSLVIFLASYKVALIRLCDGVAILQCEVNIAQIQGTYNSCFCVLLFIVENLNLYFISLKIGVIGSIAVIVLFIICIIANNRIDKMENENIKYDTIKADRKLFMYVTASSFNKIHTESISKKINAKKSNISSKSEIIANMSFISMIVVCLIGAVGMFVTVKQSQLSALISYTIMVTVIVVVIMNSLKRNKLIGENIEKLQTTQLNGALCLHNVSIYYENKIAVKNIDIDIKANEKIAIYGKGGAGKTTLFKLIKGKIDCNEGCVYFNNNPTMNNPKYLQNGIGSLCEENQLRRGSVYENLIDDVARVNEAQAIAAMKAVGLNGKNIINNLIAGNGQGISITESKQLLLAKTILQAPKILLIDGVLDSVDNVSRKEILESLKQLDMTVIIMTSIIEVANQMPKHFDL
ncbi:MAG: ATP-binding cassette domain-containing protein [Clostridia bacterium]